MASEFIDFLTVVPAPQLGGAVTAADAVVAKAIEHLLLLAEVR